MFLIVSWLFAKVQELLARDAPLRLQFCHWYRAEFPYRGDNILWTDEATFTRSGSINLRNSHVWDEENPHATVVSHHQYDFRANVWAGMTRNKLFGPLVLPNRVNSAEFRRVSISSWYQNFQIPPVCRYFWFMDLLRICYYSSWTMKYSIIWKICPWNRGGVYGSKWMGAQLTGVVPSQSGWTPTSKIGKKKKKFRFTTPLKKGKIPNNEIYPLRFLMKWWTNRMLNISKNTWFNSDALKQ